MKQFCKNQKTRSKPGERKNESLLKEKDPKKGTGKKPKGSGRRLYTDENPKDTVSVKFSTVSDVRDTLSKSSFKSKSHKRQSQIINLIHQRSRAAYQNAKDPKVKARLKKAYDYAAKRKEASKRKTQRMKKENLESLLEQYSALTLEARREAGPKIQKLVYDFVKGKPEYENDPTKIDRILNYLQDDKVPLQKVKDILTLMKRDVEGKNKTKPLDFGGDNPWIEVPQGGAVPYGSEVKFDFKTGKNYYRKLRK